MRLSATCRLGGSYIDFLTVDFQGVISFRFVPSSSAWRPRRVSGASQPSPVVAPTARGVRRFGRLLPPGEPTPSSSSSHLTLLSRSGEDEPEGSPSNSTLRRRGDRILSPSPLFPPRWATFFTIAPTFLNISPGDEATPRVTRTDTRLSCSTPRDPPNLVRGSAASYRKSSKKELIWVQENSGNYLRYYLYGNFQGLQTLLKNITFSRLRGIVLLSAFSRAAAHGQRSAPVVTSYPFPLRLPPRPGDDLWYGDGAPGVDVIAHVKAALEATAVDDEVSSTSRTW